MSAGSYHPIVPPWFEQEGRFKVGDRVRVVFRGIKGPVGEVVAPPPPPGDSRGFLGMYLVLFDGGTNERLVPEALELIPSENT